MKEIICSSNGVTEEVRKLTKSPFSLTRYLQKFQDGDSLFHPFNFSCDNQVYISCCFLFFLTTTFSNKGNDTPYFV